MKLLLDTHIFLWLISGDSRLEQATRGVVLDPENEVFLSVVSLWESIIKYHLGKLLLPYSPDTYIPRQRLHHQIGSLAVDEESVKLLSSLPTLHRDPFDRLLVCQALHHQMTIVTVDSATRAYPVTTR